MNAEKEEPTSVKCVSYASGETRRWEMSGKGDSFALLTRKVSEAFGLARPSFSWVDEDGEPVLIAGSSEPPPYALSQSLRNEELREANKATNGKLLTLTVYASKAHALEACYPKKQDKAKTPPTRQQPLDDPAPVNMCDLGPRPGRVVALDLGVSLCEARELVKRASQGEVMASRLVGPSASFWASLGKDRDIVLDNEAFTCALERRRGAEVARHTRPTRHVGVCCDACHANPILGTRYHRRGDDYDLCSADYNQLPTLEKMRFVAVDRPQQPQQRQRPISVPTSNVASVTRPPPPPRPPTTTTTTTPEAAATPAAAAAASFTEDGEASSDDEIVFVSAPARVS